MDKSRTLLILHEVGIYGKFILYYRAAIPEESKLISGNCTEFRKLRAAMHNFVRREMWVTFLTNCVTVNWSML